MEEQSKALEERVRTGLVRLNAKVQGIVTGILVGLGLFIATNWLVIKGGSRIGPHLSLLNQFFLGYRVSFAGSFIGLAYGFACGFLIGYFVAWAYNAVLRFKERKGSRAI